jgi:hypothetical protein
MDDGDVVEGEDDASRSMQAWRDDANAKHIRRTIDHLRYISLVFQFFLDKLKQTHSSLTWYIILVSSGVSFLTLLDFDAVYSSEPFDSQYDWTRNLALSFLSISTTLLAAYIKKRNFVRRMGTMSRRINDIEILASDIEHEYRKPLCQKCDYFVFADKNKANLSQFMNTSDQMSPVEWGDTLYDITVNHEVLCRNTHPWYVRDAEDPNRMEIDQNFVKLVVDSHAKIHGSLCCKWIGKDGKSELLESPIGQKPNIRGRNKTVREEKKTK